MNQLALALTAGTALLASCSSIDEYHYGYAPAYRTLPAGFEKAEIRGTSYWHHGGRFYKYDAGRGYLLVKPPRGHTEVVSPEAGATPAPNAAATRSGEPSWIKPGGGSLKDRGPRRQVGRSPIRH